MCTVYLIMSSFGVASGGAQRDRWFLSYYILKWKVSVGIDFSKKNWLAVKLTRQKSTSEVDKELDLHLALDGHFRGDHRQQLVLRPPDVRLRVQGATVPRRARI